MLGFSIQKILVLVAIIGAVWYGFKFVGRLDEARKAEAKLRGEPQPSGGLAGTVRDWMRRGGAKTGGTERGAAAEDMVECSVCGAFVAASGASSCGRDDCPY